MVSAFTFNRLTAATSVTMSVAALWLVGLAAGAQGALPLPGSTLSEGQGQPYTRQNFSAPSPSVAPSSHSAPLPGGRAALGLAPVESLVPGTTNSLYERLPLNAFNAVARLEELRNLMPTSRPKDFYEAISEYGEWLTEMADAHWRLSQTFSKADAKAQAESERQLCLKFGGLKRQTMLLKVEFLISQKRFPEALAPLVDIVTAEPRSETGQSAYRLLQQIGFSEQTALSGAKLPPSQDPSAFSKSSASAGKHSF